MTFTFSEDFREIIRIIGRGKKLQRDLTFDEAYRAMRLMLEGRASEAQIGAFLVTMRVKDESSDEIRGFREAARSMARVFRKPQIDGLVDLGLPYDGKAETLQTGAAAALVAAAAGIPVLITGADHIPTKQGVTALELFRALGARVDLSPDDLVAQIETHRFGILDLDQVLPEWTALNPIRLQFGLRTLLNTVEKLLNLFDAPIHISGLYHKTYIERFLPIAPAEKFWIVQGEEGSIELKTGKKTCLYCMDGGVVNEVTIDANDYGFAQIGGKAPKDAVYHARVIHQALADHTGAAFDQIILTAGALIWMAGYTSDLPNGIETARTAVLSGRAAELLATLSSL